MLGFMRLLLNIIWFVFGGIWLALGYVVFGVIACIFIITIPAGVASFRMANYALWPFGRSVVQKTGGSGGVAFFTNAVWVIIAGFWLALGHLTTAAAQALTIVGIPLALANLKMIPVSLFPFGKQIVNNSQIPAGYEPVVKF